MKKKKKKRKSGREQKKFQILQRLCHAGPNTETHPDTCPSFKPSHGFRMKETEPHEWFCVGTKISQRFTNLLRVHICTS